MLLTNCFLISCVMMPPSTLIPTSDLKATQPGRSPDHGILSEASCLTVAGRHYALRFFDHASLGYAEKSGKICLSMDGTAWVIDPLRPDLKDHFACRWPIISLSADRSLAVVELPDKKQLLVGVADLKKGSLMASFADDEYLGTTNRWIFSPDKRYVYALDGAAKGGWHFLDLQLKKCVRLKVAGFNPRTDAYCWSGALLAGGNKAALFLSGLLDSDGTRRMEFPIAVLEERTVAVPEIDLIPVSEMDGDHLLARVKDGRYAVFSTRTWKVVKALEWQVEDATPRKMLLGPSGQNAYLLDALEGLLVYEPKTGNLVKKYPEARGSRELTFTADGRYGVSAGERSRILIFDTRNHQVVHRLTVKRPAVMAALIEPSGGETIGTCLVVGSPGSAP